jgi:hypothetical protein
VYFNFESKNTPKILSIRLDQRFETVDGKLDQLDLSIFINLDQKLPYYLGE